MVITCQHCQKPVNEKVRFCPHCGGENIKRPGETTPRCPRCDIPLDENHYRDSTIDLCSKCKGMWLDSDEFDYHASERDTFKDASIPRKFQRKTELDSSPYLKCVRCGSLMVRRNFRKISGVMVDICRDHGAWLDAGELEQIRTFIANGGLDKSQDKDIMENREEIARISGETKDLNMLFRTLHKFDIKRIFLQRF